MASGPAARKEDVMLFTPDSFRPYLVINFTKGNTIGWYETLAEAKEATTWYVNRYGGQYRLYVTKQLARTIDQISVNWDEN